MVKVFKLKNILFATLAVILVTVLSLSVYFTGAYAVYFGNTPRLLPVYSVEREDKVVSISFDCAWGVDYTDEILNALKVSNVRATWFMVEFWTEKYEDYVKKINSAGHEIGTHSSTQVELFRPPYGDYDDELIKTASELGYYSIQWDVDSLDWKDLSATDIAMRVINNVKNGSIILMHNNGLHTAEAVPIILETLKNKGFTFVPIGELIYRENYSIDGTGRQQPVK